MPHATVSASERTRCCPYCGAPTARDRRKDGPYAVGVTCAAHRDLPAHEPLDDRYTLTEDHGR